MKVTLDQYSINNVIKQLDFLSDQITNANELIVLKLTEAGAKHAQSLNANAPYTGESPSPIIARATENGQKGYIALIGDNAVYDEFGTGEEGATNPHPLKDVVSPTLNPYNSGPYVSTHINDAGRHYWYYPPTGKSGNPWYQSSGYTEGVPAGKVMYNTSVYVRSLAPKVVQKELSSAIKVFNEMK